MQHAFRLTLLGTFRLEAPDGSECHVPAAKQRGLIAALVLAPDAQLTPERAMALLWSDRGEPQARDSLKHALAELRKRLAPLGADILETTRTTVALNLAALEVDVGVFERLCANGTIADVDAALEMALGGFLDGLNVRDPAFDDWIRLERQRLRQLAETSAGRLLRQIEAGADGDGAVPIAQKLLRLDPLREDAVRCLMRHHAMQGERSVALRLFDDLKAALHSDLGAAPEGPTEALAQQILARTPATARQPANSGRSDPVPAKTRPSVAVLPFRNASGDPEQAYFADGIAEDIITALSQFRWFPVIARDPSFAFRDRQPGLKEIARELGVRYILDGSIRKVGSRVRLSAELIEPETGFHVWGDRYDRELADIFEIQDDLTRHVAGSIEPEILRGESRRALSKPPVSLDAYDCHMRGIWYHNLQGGREDFEQAIHWQRRAIELDPTLARAYMILARSIYARCLYGYSDDMDSDRRELIRLATQSVAMEDRDAYAHYAMCMAHMTNQQAAAGVIDAERAVELAPNLALVQCALGWSRIYAGQFEEAIGPIETAMRISPRDPISYFFNSRLGLAHYHLGNFEEAARYSQRSLFSRPRYFNMLILLASLGKLGRNEDARALLPQVQANQPPDPELFWKLIFPYANPADRAMMEEGLSRAGF